MFYPANSSMFAVLQQKCCLSAFRTRPLRSICSLKTGFSRFLNTRVAASSLNRQVNGNSQKHNERARPCCCWPVGKQSEKDSTRGSNVKRRNDGVSKRAIGARSIRALDSKPEHACDRQHIEDEGGRNHILEQIAIEVSSLRCRIVDAGSTSTAAHSPCRRRKQAGTLLRRSLQRRGRTAPAAPWHSRRGLR